PLRILTPERRRMVFAVAYSADGKLLASGGYDQSVHIWDAASGREVRTLRGHASGVASLAFRPDGRRLASGGEDGVIKIWDATKGSGPTQVAAESHVRYTGLAFSPDGRWVASATQDYSGAVRAPGAATREKLVRLWEAATGAPGPALRGHDEDITDVAFG